MRGQLIAAETALRSCALELSGGSLVKEPEDRLPARNPYKGEIAPKLAMLAVCFLGELLQFVQFGAIVFNTLAGNRDIKMLGHWKIL